MQYLVLFGQDVFFQHVLVVCQHPLDELAVLCRVLLNINLQLILLLLLKVGEVIPNSVDVLRILIVAFWDAT